MPRLNRFPKDPIGRAPQTNPAHWGEGGACYSSVPLPRRLPGQLVRVVAQRGSPWDWLPGTGMVVAAGSTPRGLPWYQVFVGGTVHELWAEELEGMEGPEHFILDAAPGPVQIVAGCGIL